MAHVSQHACVISLVGVVTAGFPKYPILLVLPHCEHGSLEALLKQRGRGEQNCLMLKSDTSMAHDTCSGMAHISGTSLVHRDLSARNVLVCAFAFLFCPQITCY